MDAQTLPAGFQLLPDDFKPLGNAREGVSGLPAGFQKLPADFKPLAPAPASQGKGIPPGLASVDGAAVPQPPAVPPTPGIPGMERLGGSAPGVPLAHPVQMQYSQFANVPGSNDPRSPNYDPSIDQSLEPLPGLAQMYTGARQLGRPLAAAVSDIGRTANPLSVPISGPDALTPELANQGAAGLSSIIEGGMRAASPAMIVPAVMNPLGTVGTLIGAYAADKAGEAGLSALGASPEFSRLGGNVISLGVVGGGMRYILGSTDAALAEHNATAARLFDQERTGGQQVEAFNDIFGGDSHPIVVNGQNATLEYVGAAASETGRARGLWRVVGEDGKVLRQDLAPGMQSWLQARNAVAQAAGGTPIDQIAPHLDEQYSQIVGERAEAQSAVDQRKSLQSAPPEKLQARAATLQANIAGIESAAAQERAAGASQSLPKLDALDHAKFEAQSELDLIQQRLAGKEIPDDLYAQAAVQDADAKLSDIQKLRAQTGAPGTQMPQGQRPPVTTPPAAAPPLPSDFQPIAEPAAATTENPSVPPVEAKQKDLIQGAQFTTDQGVYTVKKLTPKSVIYGFQATGQKAITPRPMPIEDFKNLVGLNAPQVPQEEPLASGTTPEAPPSAPTASSPSPEPQTSGTPAQQAEDATPPAEEVPKHDYASTQANIQEPVASEVRAAADLIPKSELADKGIETEPHITALYGLHAEDPTEVAKILQDQPPITATFGPAMVFKGEDKDVLVAQVESPDLHRINAALRTLPYTSDFPNYTPHMTLAYLKPGEGAKYEGQPIPGVTGKQVTLNSIAFSGKDGKQVEIPLTGSVTPPATGTPGTSTVDGNPSTSNVAPGTPELPAQGTTPADIKAHNEQAARLRQIAKLRGLSSEDFAYAMRNPGKYDPALVREVAAERGLTTAEPKPPEVTPTPKSFQSGQQVTVARGAAQIPGYIVHQNADGNYLVRHEGVPAQDMLSGQQQPDIPPQRTYSPGDIEPRAQDHSFKVEVEDGGKWTPNGQRWASADEAQKAGSELYSRWMGMGKWRVAPSADPVNYYWDKDNYRGQMIDETHPAPPPAPPKVTGAPALIEAVYQKLKSGGSLGNIDAFNRMAEEAYGASRTSGTWTPKDAFDAMEAGINRYLLDDGKQLMAMPAEEGLNFLRQLMGRITSQGVRTEEQIANQQFSTPPTEGYVLAKIADLKPTDVVLEPSAGNGGLAIWPKSIGATVYVNEISERRRQMLEAVGFTNISNHDGELINTLLDRGILPTVILMNPPFSAGTVKSGPAANDNKYGFNHLNHALQRLQPGGRLIAILGGGRADDMNGGATLLGGPSGKWFHKIAERYNIRANVRIHGKEYQKYGTSFATRIIVIDKTGPTPKPSKDPTARWSNVIRGNADTLEQAYNLLKDVGPRSSAPAGNVSGAPANQPAAPKTPTGNRPGTGVGGVRGGGVRTGPTGPGSGQLRPGEPAGNGASDATQRPGEQAGGVQPGPAAPEHPETAPAGTAQSGPENADFQRPPIPGADGDLAAAFGDPQALIDATIKALGEKLGQKPSAPRPAAAPAPAPAAATAPPTAPAPTANPFSSAAQGARDRLKARRAGEKAQFSRFGNEPPEYPASLQANPSPKVNQPLNPDDVQDLMLIGAEHIMNGATDYPTWVGKVNADVGDLVADMADKVNGSPDQILRLIYQMAGAATSAYGVTPMPAPAPQPAPTPNAPLTGNEFDNTPLSLDRDTLPKSEEEDSTAYVTYRPTLKGPAHPGDIVETKTMSTVPIPPITYKPNLPQSILDKGLLSAVQLEAMALAGQQNDIVLPDGSRSCALIGDGTGVGKGRIAAAYLYDNWRKGRKRQAFITEKWDLMQDILRDLSGIEAKELTRGVERDKNGAFRTSSTSAMRQFNKYQYGAKIGLQGVLFSTYGTVRAENAKGVSRASQLIEYLRGDDDGEGACMVLDEAHALKNAVTGRGGQASQIGVAMRAILAAVPKLRILPMSATAATDVMNLGYLDRLGIWGPGTPFPTGFMQFAAEIGNNGISAMEMIARELKAQGKYLSRTLSFKGVTYTQGGEAEHKLNPEQKALYRTAARAWREVVQNVETSIATSTNGGTQQRSRFLSQFGAAQQRFFGLLITALKTPTALSLANKALAEGKSVVVSLVNTNEAAQNREKARVAAMDEDEEIPDYDFGPKRMLIDLVREHFPVQDYRDDVDDAGNPIKVAVTHDDGKGNQVPSNNPKRKLHAMP
jgi:2'-5' RNA ligase/phage FluMu protein gp41